MAVAGSLTYDTKIDKDGFEKGINSLEKSTNKAMKNVLTAVSAVTTAIAGISIASINSYADLEQNIGGVETLFKDSADELIKNAEKAYKTAGLSANAYMETATSFSASLLQSLGGDTKKAVNYADQAIIDMSDNANKMGTSMEAIQNAYQGFAKQNYTMLDNLKLGYGGTKTEMERLIADANKVKQANGEMADLSIESFADVTDAIHIIQTEMGITGTTAKEAEETISGSISAMKASWDNFLNGSGTFDELVESAKIAFNNILSALSELLPRITEEIVNALPEGLVTTIKIITPILVTLGTALRSYMGIF